MKNFRFCFGQEYLLLESLFWRFFLLAYGSVFGSRICIDFCFQRLQYEGSNGFSQIWLITVISYIPLVLADHCSSSIFSSSFGTTVRVGFFVKTAKYGFGSPFWLTAVDALNLKIQSSESIKSGLDRSSFNHIYNLNNIWVISL